MSWVPPVPPKFSSLPWAQRPFFYFIRLEKNSLAASLSIPTTCPRGLDSFFPNKCDWWPKCDHWPRSLFYRGSADRCPWSTGPAKDVPHPVPAPSLDTLESVRKAWLRPTATLVCPHRWLQGDLRVTLCPCSCCCCCCYSHPCGDPALRTAGVRPGAEPFHASTVNISLFLLLPVCTRSPPHDCPTLDRGASSWVPDLGPASSCCLWWGHVLARILSLSEDLFLLRLGVEAQGTGLYLSS